MSLQEVVGESLLETKPPLAAHGLVEQYSFPTLPELDADSFELFAIHEAAADPDGATDAIFRVVEVEYV